MASLHKAAKEDDITTLKNDIEELKENGALQTDIAKALGQTDAYHLTPLHYAVKYQHVDIIRILLRHGADVNIKGDNGTNCLHYAARYFDLEEHKTGEEILDLLLAAKDVDVNSQDNDKATPLHYACLKNNYKAVRKLLTAKKINLEAKDKWESTPLQSACSVGSIAIVKRLLKSGARVDVVNEAHNSPLHLGCSGGHEAVVIEIFDQTERLYGFSTLSNMIVAQNREGQSPLHVAVLASHFHIIKILLERGANVNQIMAEGETALHVAAVTGHLGITWLLLSHDALIDAKNDDGRTPLHKSATFGKSEVVNLLLEKGADVNLKGRFKVTALMLAASSNYASIVSLLLQKDADITIKDFEGRTALHLAAAGNAFEALKVLLEAKNVSSILNAEDKDGNTALHISCLKGFDEITKILLEAGVEVSPRNNSEQTPAHMASLFGRSDVVEELLQKDASTLNDIDKQGNAALHLAAQKGHIETILVLLHSGASINDRNTELLTPLDCAARYGEVAAAKVLLDGKASVDPMDKHGMTPLLHACVHGHGKMVELLLQYCDISLTDSSGRNCLDLAIDNGQKDAAIAILSHRDWRMAMRNKTFENGVVTTPMRKMIKKLPDVCSLALNRCLRKSESLPSDHRDYSITLDYEFLDDVYNEWTFDSVRLDSEEGKGQGAFLTQKEIAGQLKEKKNHTLSVMVEYKRESLLSHPLVNNLLSWKWNLFSGKLYYLKLSLYCIFLHFLTGYILHTAPMRQPFRNEHCQLNDANLKGDFFDKFYVEIGRVVILGLAIIHLIFELMQMVAQRADYISFENALEIMVYFLAIVNVSDDLIKLPVNISCVTYQQSVGAYAIFFAWINLVLFIRKIPKFGIYIVMFGFVARTFIQFFIVFVLLIIAFAFGFYILLADSTEIGAFSTPLKAIVKTMVMMSGELDYGSIFDGSHKPPPATWPIFIGLVLLLTIILMNLLVGLAVDDIQEVQKQAVLNRMKMQIDLLLDAEKTLPGSIRQMFTAKTPQVIYPNRKRRWFSALKQSENFMKALDAALKAEKSVMEQLKEQTNDLERKSVALEKRMVEMSEKVEKLDKMDDQLAEIKGMMSQLLKKDQ